MVGSTRSSSSSRSTSRGRAGLVALDAEPGAQVARPAAWVGATPMSAVSRVSSIVLPGVLVEAVAATAARAARARARPGSRPAAGAAGPAGDAVPSGFSSAGAGASTGSAAGASVGASTAPRSAAAR